MQALTAGRQSLRARHLGMKQGGAVGGGAVTAGSDLESQGPQQCLSRGYYRKGQGMGTPALTSHTADIHLMVACGSMPLTETSMSWSTSPTPQPEESCIPASERSNGHEHLPFVSPFSHCPHPMGGKMTPLTGEWRESIHPWATLTRAAWIIFWIMSISVHLLLPYSLLFRSKWAPFLCILLPVDKTELWSLHLSFLACI